MLLLCVLLWRPAALRALCILSHLGGQAAAGALQEQCWKGIYLVQRPEVPHGI